MFTGKHELELVEKTADALKEAINNYDAQIQVCISKLLPPYR